MTYTIWGNGRRFEYLIRDDAGEIVQRSGWEKRGRSAAKRAVMKALAA